MKAVEQIWHAHVDGGEGLIALIVYGREPYPEGLSFVTQPEAPLQLAVMRHPAGKVVEPHSHPPQQRKVYSTQEVLFVRRGKLRADFYSIQRERVCSRTLEAGDAVLLIHGGHGFTMLEETELLEIKQGPYLGAERDKVHFA